MRTMRAVLLAVLVALAFASPVAAQSAEDRVSFNAAVGPSFGNVGTTFSTLADLNLRLSDRAAIVGEFGVLPHAPFSRAAEIAPPAVGGPDARVNAYHWNGNLKVRPFDVARFEPYVTGGVGSFTADTVLNDVRVGTTSVTDRRRATNFATNLGAGITYRLTDRIGVGADYRTFFVHRDEATPRVNRLTAGVTFSLN